MNATIEDIHLINELVSGLRYNMVLYHKAHVYGLTFESRKMRNANEESMVTGCTDLVVLDATMASRRLRSIPPSDALIAEWVTPHTRCPCVNCARVLAQIART